MQLCVEVEIFFSLLLLRSVAAAAAVVVDPMPLGLN